MKNLKKKRMLIMTTLSANLSANLFSVIKLRG